jgi:hypothetical protein
MDFFIITETIEATTNHLAKIVTVVAKEPLL